MTTNYMLLTGHGDQIADGIPAEIIERVAQEKADQLGETVYYAVSGATLERAEERLIEAGYSLSSASNDDRLILEVSSEADPDAAEATLDELRAIIGAGYAVAYTGDSNTEADGYTTDDVAIHVAEPVAVHARNRDADDE